MKTLVAQMKDIEEHKAKWRQQLIDDFGDIDLPYLQVKYSEYVISMTTLNLRAMKAGEEPMELLQFEDWILEIGLK